MRAIIQRSYETFEANTAKLIIAAYVLIVIAFIALNVSIK